MGKLLFKLKKLYPVLYRRYVNFKFCTVFNFHQKATKKILYKTWHEMHFTNAFHCFVLVIYVLGLSSGLIGSLIQSNSAYAANGARLVKDINALANVDNIDTDFINVNGTLYFFVGDYEIWKSDGTPGGTSLAVNLFNFRAESGVYASEQEAVGIGDTLYFTARTDEAGKELWKTDGTEAGTEMVRDIYEGTNSSDLRYFTVIGDTLYFNAVSGSAYNSELWKSDGTEAGTVMVKDIRAGLNSASVKNLINVNGTLYFSADDGTNGAELWKSDGTETGTTMVKDIYSGIVGSAPANMLNIGSELYFSAKTSANGIELWKSDGTDAGTVLVKDIYPGATASSPANLTNVNGTIYFSAKTSANGIELWKSDGTDAGTVLVKDIYPGVSNSSPNNLVNVNNTLYFAASNGTNGVELWKSDGTSSGTTLVKDIYAGSSASTPTSIKNVNGMAAFMATDGVDTFEYWVSDGTDSGTVKLRTFSDFSTYFIDAFISKSVVIDNVLYFGTFTPDDGFILWASDGTDTGTSSVLNHMPGTDSSAPTGLAVTENGTVFFSADDGLHGWELWKSDGTEAGTTMVKDIYPGGDDSDSLDTIWIANIGNTVFFPAYSPDYGEELWKSDGTEEGTVMVTDLAPGTDDGGADFPIPAGDKLYFWGYDMALYVTDGTTVTQLTDPSDGGYNNIGYVNGIYYFDLGTASEGVELWKTDGTVSGTSMVKDINPGEGSSWADNSASYYYSYGHTSAVDTSGFFYFNAYDPTNGNELWKTDGTEAGTTLVADINPGSGDSDPDYFTELNGKIYFKANTTDYGYELWVTDGTSSGTTLVKDIYPGTTDSIPYGVQFVKLNNKLYFAANDGEHGKEIWMTDGTADGTELVADIVNGSAGSSPNRLLLINGKIYFDRADASYHDDELWVTNGTETGTRLVLNAFEGDLDTSIYDLVNVGNTIYFVGFNDQYGDELWSYDTTQESGIADSISPAFNNLPSDTRIINVNEGATITSSDTYNISVYPTDNVAMQKVEFYINSVLTSTDTTADGNGLYTFAWTPTETDTSIKAIAYDTSDNHAEVVRNITVELTESDNTPPVFTNLPGEDRTININEGQTVTEESSYIKVRPMDNVAISMVWLYLNGQHVSTLYSAGNDGVYDFSWTPHETDTIARVVAYDSSNNTAEITRNFTVKLPVATSATSVTTGSGQSTEESTTDINNLTPITEPLAPSVDDSIKTPIFQDKVTTSKSISALTFASVSIAYIFPYILFILLLILAFRLLKQASDEKVHTKRLLEILNFEKQIFEEKQNFLILSSHYLRTPLTLITSSSSELGSAGKALSRAIAKLSGFVSRILSELDGDTYLAEIKKPNIEKAKKQYYLSPYLWLPIILVGMVAIVADLLFIYYAKIDISIINLIIEGIAFVLVGQYFISTFRSFYNETEGSRKLTIMIKHQRAMEAATNEFILKSSSGLEPLIKEVENLSTGKEGGFLKTIKLGLFRLRYVQSKLVMIAKLKTGKLLPNFSKFSPIDSVKDIIGTKLSEIDNKNITINYSGDNLIIKQDRNKIEYVLSQLVENAIKFNSIKGVININLLPGDNSNYVLSIEDTGSGIGEDDLHNIFKPFSRAESAMTFNYEGVGLSLYLSKVVMEYLGGDISVSSKPGEGTKVSLLLPKK